MFLLFFIYFIMKTKKRFLTTHELILSALFIALISVGAFIKIPIGTVPITLQFMFVLLAGQILYPKSAVVTMIVYVAMGILGLPVFSGGGGLSYVLTPTFGYILGFIAAAIIVSIISKKCNRSFLKLFLANLLGFVFVYAFGLSYYILLSLFYFNTVLDLGSILLMGFVVFIPTDILFCVLTAIISKRINIFLTLRKA